MSILDQPKICSSLPRIRDPDLVQELKRRGIELTDIGPETPPIDMLIGADFLGGILTGRIEVLPSGITAVETKLGWSVLGPGKKSSINMVSLCMHHSEIHKIWDLESLGITDPTERKTTKELDEETVTFFQETIRKTGNRYEVALPWLAGHPHLYNGYDQAEARLHTVTKRLLKDNYYELYDGVLQQWKNDNIIEEVTEAEMSSSNACHYLPHHPVVKSSSATTKVRPVFDASCKRPGYASLNDCLSTGPSLLSEIPRLISKFRCGAIGVIADIKQAFLQLSLAAKDRDYLRFLWWEDKKHTKMKFYRHCRVVFGVSSSPFLLNATIKFHLESQEFQSIVLQNTINRMKDGFYVDNLVTSVNTSEELEQLKSQAIEVMQKGSFELRCWAYSGIEESIDQNVLGLKWDTHADELYCAGCKTTSEKILSKRKLLSVVNSIYDPIGFTSPATLLPKLLLQEAWKNKIGWDDDLPLNIQHRYQHWVKHIDFIEQCRIPRRLMLGTLENTSLHVFTDASADAYACCVYLRSEEETGTSVQLITAKARVAPMKRPTIPRLELLGATMGARIASTVLEAIQQPLKISFWVDSMVVLSWITKGEPWNTFVGNRVKEIRQLTNVDSWRFVPGSMNPADLPSRSCNWKELIDSRWWEGPTWLQETENTWPNTEITMPEEALVERKKSVICSTNINLQENFSKKLLYFSKYSKVIRMVAWMLRFINNARNKSTRVISELTCEEIQKAELAVIKLVQTELHAELKEKYSKSIRFSEESGVLKVETKLVLGEDPEDFQKPTVLPDHPIVRLYIEYVHKALMHSGVQTTLNHIRELYWIPRGRRVVRKEISVGEIVLIGCEDTKRLNWPLGHVVELYPGRDGIQRIAKLRVANGYLVRPLQRLYPLEMSISDLPSDLAANGKEVAANIDSGYLY
ncbi:uncharacterized protein LOC129234298 [Uloborus diversus]|uniref:uncharacterized protein LOC129234298 n=1 Tax=Uloborus diversus TaxID=327109 RepID=UPI0024095242|nr:uncharacterized protein LOC129234298 [Uloborus diversus]